ncbi:hypothetical protein [Paenibacillus ihumii]|nr:hypothetical protein [Paenibacillus ihumii]
MSRLIDKGSKNDMRLVEYYNDMNDEQKTEFYEQAMIPQYQSRGVY